MDPQAAPPNKTPRPKRWRLRALVCTPLAVLCLVTLLHPYLRQSLFGPTVRGKPLCYWQDQFRARAEPDEYRNSFSNKLNKLLVSVGLKNPTIVDDLPVSDFTDRGFRPRLQRAAARFAQTCRNQRNTA